MLRQSVGPRREVSVKPALSSSTVRTYVAAGQKILDKPAQVYAVMVDKVKAASPAHIPSARLTLHAFVDGFVHLVGPRFFSHFLIVIMAAIIATVSGITTSRMSRAATLNPWQFDPFTVRSLTDSKDYIGKPTLPFTISPKRAREAPVIYEVKAGDTLTGIASQFEISPETIISANKLDDADSLGLGDKLTILPVSGILHVVVEGDTVESIAAKYQVEGLTIIQNDYNDLTEPYTLLVDQKLIVQGGTMPEVKRPVPVARSERAIDPPPANAQQSTAPPAAQPSPPSPPASNSAPVRGGNQFTWPVAGQITQGFSGYHLGIDVGAPVGTTIFASDAGVVTAESTGWDGGWGWNLIIDHGNGLSSRYSHVSKFLVSQGQTVTRGQPIALVGMTGLTTGPHLHFEFLLNGVRVNPSKYLP